MNKAEIIQKLNVIHGKAKSEKHECKLLRKFAADNELTVADDLNAEGLRTAILKAKKATNGSK